MATISKLPQSVIPCFKFIELPRTNRTAGGGGGGGGGGDDDDDASSMESSLKGDTQSLMTQPTWPSPIKVGESDSDSDSDSDWSLTKNEATLQTTKSASSDSNGNRPKKRRRSRRNQPSKSSVPPVDELQPRRKKQVTTRATTKSPTKRKSQPTASSPTTTSKTRTNASTKTSTSTSTTKLVQFNGKLMHINAVMKINSWPVRTFLRRRKRRGKVQYLCDFEDTWETEDLVEALEDYKNSGHKPTVLQTKTKKMPGGKKSVTLQLCRWPNRWEPEENLSDSVRQEAILDVLEHRDWSIQTVLEVRTVGQNEEYRIKWEDTWETTETVEEMMRRKEDYDVTVLETKTTRKRGTKPETLCLCRWAPEWVPKENLTDAAKKKALIDLEGRQQHKKNVDDATTTSVPRQQQEENAIMETNGGGGGGGENDNRSDECTPMENPESPMESAAAVTTAALPLETTTTRVSSGHEGNVENMGCSGGEGGGGGGGEGEKEDDNIVEEKNNEPIENQGGGGGTASDSSSDGGGSSTFSIEQMSGDEDYVDPQIPMLVEFVINGGNHGER